MEAKKDFTNPQFRLASAYVNYTDKHIFLTGKAGTGKTTFLKHIVQHCSKKFVIVAPTGVAAINAGGVTAHSMFQLPIGVFVPGTIQGFTTSHSQVTDKHSLFRNLKVNAEKRKIWQELELLIIDEISMMRADMLDAIDQILRNYRKQLYKPFGGVQVLYIGDMYQLPPVVAGNEWELLGKYYQSPYFFDSLVAKEAPPITVELKTIYRQSERTFIRILNNIRNNQLDYDDLETLHERYMPNFEPADDEGYILLTTHNPKADSTNLKKLNELTSKPHYYEAIVDGDFNDKAYPAEPILQLKVGAQIMFIKNDKREPRRYYNGKIGFVKNIDNNGVVISFNEGGEDVILEREVWKNIRYKYNENRASIDEEELGSFSQYPVRLAWAITIHKSQGLTFEKAIIDAGASFAPGQVYVALSRLTSFNGLVLQSRIEPRGISTDPRVIAFTEYEMNEVTLENTLTEAQREFLGQKLQQTFEFTKLLEAVQLLCGSYPARSIAEKENAEEWSKKLFQSLLDIHDTGTKFIRQLSIIFPEAAEDGYRFLNERVASAVRYFSENLEQKVIASFKEHYAAFAAKARTKKYLKDLSVLDPLLRQKEQELKQIAAVTQSLATGADMLDVLEQNIKKIDEEMPILSSIETATGKKLEKVDTKTLSFTMFQEGKMIEEIAKERSLAVSTIETHLVHFVRSGEIEVTKLVPEQKLNEIVATMQEANSRDTGLIKNMLGDNFSYMEIRAVQQYLMYKEQRA